MNVIIQLFLYDLNICKNNYELMRKQLRTHEYDVCLYRNCQDSHIKSIHIFVDTQEAMNHFSNITNIFPGKAIYVLHGRQPTYKDLVSYAMKTFGENEQVCIMNNDMYFNSENDHFLIQKLVRPNRLISLTRHELTDENHTLCNLDTCNFTGNGGSSDVFIFQMPISSSFNLDRVDHKQNMFGAENVFHKAWTDAGYHIINPCDDIKTIHIHKDRIHFEKYDYIESMETWSVNWKTKLEDDLKQ